VEENHSALWLRCPLCNCITETKVYPETVLLSFPLYCPECEREIRVNVASQKITVCDEPDD